jgi:hypothetical protein
VSPDQKERWSTVLRSDFIVSRHFCKNFSHPASSPPAAWRVSS